MRLIGLTGPTGSGKSAVSRFLEETGAFIIDADKVSHDIILKGKDAYKELVEYFGEEILDKNGEIARRKLGDIVFSQGGDKLEFLNNCTHKHIYNEIINLINEAENRGEKTTVLDAPLLIEEPFVSICKEIWVVYAEDETRAERIMNRDLITREQAHDRMKRQHGYDVYNKYASVIIDNNGDLENVKKQVYSILEISESDD